MKKRKHTFEPKSLYFKGFFSCKNTTIGKKSFFYLLKYIFLDRIKYKLSLLILIKKDSNMNKLLKTIMTFIFAATVFTSANSIEVRVGATATAAAFYGNAEEVLKDGGHKSQDEVLAAYDYVSLFTEVAFEEMMGLTVGVEYTPDSIAFDKTTRTIRDGTLPGLAAQTGNDTGDQVLDADVEDLYTAYVSMPLMGTGVYAKVGYITGTVNTKETLATGSTYSDVTLDGFEYGIGYHGELSDRVFYKVESTYIDFDDISANGSEAGGDGSFNKITAELGGVTAKASLGMKF